MNVFSKLYQIGSLCLQNLIRWAVYKCVSKTSLDGLFMCLQNFIRWSVYKCICKTSLNGLFINVFTKLHCKTGHLKQNFENSPSNRCK